MRVGGTDTHFFVIVSIKWDD